jgi:hypothetical protein
MRHTRLTADFPLTVVVRFRDGLIVRFDGYRERCGALQRATRVVGELTTPRYGYSASPTALRASSQLGNERTSRNVPSRKPETTNPRR